MKIYHYTDLNGLKGIIESNSLWATNFRFLNDAAELEHGTALFVNALNYLTDELGQDNIELMREKILEYKTRQSWHQYNISFCEAPDLLSQWRGYGSAQGVCIEFDSDELLESLNFRGLFPVYGSVFYTKTKETLKIREEILRFMADERLISKSRKSNLWKILSTAELVSQLPPMFKDESFSEEREFRIVLQSSHRDRNVEFRVNAYGLIPFIKIHAHEDGVCKGRLPVRSVMVGPCRDPNFVREGIRMLLESNGHHEYDLFLTQTPYRG